MVQINVAAFVIYIPFQATFLFFVFLLFYFQYFGTFFYILYNFKQLLPLYSDTM